jgi:glycosyltransferase involved in cell wall biosynthesis
VINTCLPSGNYHGWGICGDALNRAISPLADGWLVAFPPSGPTDIFGQTSPLYRRLDAGFPLVVASPLLQAIQGENLLPVRQNLWSSEKNGGYIFAENNIRIRDFAPNGRRYFEHIFAGSTWLEDVLREAGLNNVSTVVQGVDVDVFKPMGRTRWRDSFVIFSGGKFEYRKGQDIVIRATAIMMERHSDVMLLPLWYNPWTQTMLSMAKSKHIKISSFASSYEKIIYTALTENGIPLDRVIPVEQPVQHGPAVAELIANCNVGCFPCRCEGGTNLVLMEAFACGLPCVASTGTGHADVVDATATLSLERYTETPIYDGGQHVATWPEPDIDEVVDKLELAYAHGGPSVAGELNRQRMQQFTWAAAAKKFYEVLTQ